MDLDRWMADRRLKAQSVPMLVAVVVRDGDAEAVLEAARGLARLARGFLVDALDPPHRIVPPIADRIADLFDLLAIARGIQAAGTCHSSAAEDLELVGQRVAAIFPPPAPAAEAVRQTGSDLARGGLFDEAPR